MMNRSPQNIINGAVGKENKRTTALNTKREAYPQETRMTVRALQLKNEQKQGNDPPTPPEGQCEQIAADASPPGPLGLVNGIEGEEAEDHQLRQLPFSSPSSAFGALPMPMEVLEGHLWEALWPYMCVPQILQMRVASHNWNNASKYGPYCELFFYLMKHEQTDGEELVSSPFVLFDYMRTVKSRSTDGNEDSLFNRYLA